MVEEFPEGLGELQLSRGWAIVPVEQDAEIGIDSSTVARDEKWLLLNLVLATLSKLEGL